MTIPAAKCPDCGDAIIWMVTRKGTGRWIAADYIPGYEATSGDLFDKNFNRSHASTCSAEKKRKHTSKECLGCGCYCGWKCSHCRKAKK